MHLSETFIRRPIATLLLAAGLFLAGIVAFFILPVASMPRVDQPTINVSAKLPGADPETMAATVAAPLERRLGEIGGVTELTSTSTSGSVSIVVQFDLDRDIEGAAHDVQAALNASSADLPTDLPSPPTWRKSNPADAPVLILAVTSDQLPPGQLYDACDTIIAQRLSQISGVAQVTVTGAQKPAVRVDADPTALAEAGLDLDSVRTALDATNADQAKGFIDEPDGESLAITTNDQLNVAADYAPLIIATTKNGSILRLSSVAHVYDGSENILQTAWYNKTKGVLIIIQKQADANVIDTVDSIKAELPLLKSWMPAGTRVSVLNDRTVTIRGSVHDVERTLMISICLVILVVLFALGRLTPTLAAAVTVPLSLAGTFGAMWMLGYSIDNISLMALVISVGFVVDDAIVMIENIARHVEQGASAFQGAIEGAKEITFTIISISISLVAVFIPLIFMGGVIGRIFREFAVTLTVAIAISALVSITVTPTVYAHLTARASRRQLKHARAAASLHQDPALNPWMQWFAGLGEAAFTRSEAVYMKGLRGVMRHKRLMQIVMLATIALTVVLYVYIPKGFIPQEDTGALQGTTEARTDISFHAISAMQEQVLSIMLADPGIAAIGSSAGGGSGPGGSNGNQGRMYITLKPLSQRNASADQIINRLRPKLAKIGGVTTFLQSTQDIRVGGRSSKAQFQFVLWDESLSELRDWTPRFIAALKQEHGLTDVSSDQDAAEPEIKLMIDRDAATRLGVTVEQIDNVLEDAFAQRQISVMYKERNQYHVVLDADANDQKGPEALNRLYVKSQSGKLVQLGRLAQFVPALAPLSVSHQGQFPAATLTFNLAEGASLGEAADHLQSVANKIRLPATIHTEFAGNAKAFADMLATQPLLIASALIAIYIVLGILYENLRHPLTILSTLPSAGIGALLALIATHNDLSLISIIGVILLMGIVKKNGIMLVDFAIVAERERGLSPEEAIVLAASQRFRPIVMTTLAAVFGALPLALAHGNGAELRAPLGVAIVGGLILSQILTLFTTPVVYLALGGHGVGKKLSQIPAEVST